MKILSAEEILSVSGGLSDSEANQIIGDALGTAWHGLTSKEGMTGLFLGGIGGAIAGSIIHFNSRH
jgi:hypothetical protein